MGSYRIIFLPVIGSLSYQMGSYRIIFLFVIGSLSYQIGSYRIIFFSLSAHYRIKSDRIVSFFSAYPLIIVSNGIVSYHFFQLIRSLSYQMGSYRIILVIIFTAMEVNVHTFKLNLDWNLMGLVSQIDRFDATWSSIEKKEGQGLRQLKSVATVRSVGASTRIEGATMSDEEIAVLISKINVSKFEDRDEQEASGYFNTHNLITESFDDIHIGESELKSLHNTLLKQSEKDAWHRGAYKKHSNVVELTKSDGQSEVVFRPTEPGFPTDSAMQALVEWYESDEETHPLVRCAIFSYEFVSIHPFQDGNGRLSRLLSTLLLLKHGYVWIQYVSFEHEIERRKNEYYGALRKCQSGRPGKTSRLGFCFSWMHSKTFKISSFRSSSRRVSNPNCHPRKRRF